MPVSVFDYEGELSACAAGDSAAFRALYDREAATMHALASAMLGPEAAAPVVHEAFVLIWRNAAGYSPSIGTARAWMYSILRYRAMAYQKDASNPVPSHAAGALPALPGLDPETSETNGTNAVSKALAALPRAQQDALLHAYLYGGRYADIAADLDRSEPDVRASIESALKRIDEAVSA